MTERLEGLSIGLDLETMKVNSGLDDLKSRLKTVNSEMKANMSAFDRSDRSVGKYETRLKGLNKKLEVQRAVTDKAYKSYRKMVDEYGEGSTEAEKAAKEYNNQAASLNNLERYVERTKDELAKLKEEQRIANSNWTKMGDKLHNTGSKVKNFGSGMSDIGSTLNRNVTLPLGIVGGAAIKTGMDFEAGMSKVKAVSGASAEEMKNLETKAREMGKTSVFSAKETSDAFYYMSLAGWDATEMMDGISGVMDLAAASGEDLASVSDIVTDGLTAFGESAKESTRMADILAATSSKANTDVKGLGLAFQYAAPVAGALGYTMEDTSKAIGLMANAGIKGEKSGTALRTMMTNLSKPTKQMKKAMDKYNISLTDSNGKMKSFDDVMKDLRKNLGKLDKKQQAAAAATIFGKEAMSGALAVVNASEGDYKKLTSAIEGSEGAASEMADTMQDNVAGSIKELKSMLQDLFIEMYKNLKPTIETTIDLLKDLTNWFAELSPKTQENIVKFGLLSAAAGPILSIFGKLTVGTGMLMQGMGGLSKTIGVAKGTGTAASIARLGKGGVVGLAIAGVAALGIGIYKLTEKSKESKEVNIDLAKSLSDQATDLENSAETFDKLSNKAKISNDELARLNDLNIRISQSSNPGEIAELQKQYDHLAKKSGLSKDELKKLFKANEKIIDQSPDVKTQVSEQGNAFAKNTDAVNKYVESLYEMTRTELEGQLSAALSERANTQQDINNYQKELNGLLDEMSIKNQASELSMKENKARQQEINKLLNDRTIKADKATLLQQELTALMDIENGDHAKAVNHLQNKINKKRESIEESEQELAKTAALKQEMQNIILKQAGINAEGQKGLAQLDQSIVKNNEEILALEQKRQKNGELTIEEQKRYDKLVASNTKQQEAKLYIFEELGLYRDINSLLDTKLTKLSQEEQQDIKNLAKKAEIKVEEGNIVKQIQNKNNEHLKERENLIKNGKQQGLNKQEIRNQVAELDKKIGKNDDVLKKILKEAGLWDQVKDEINLGSKAIDRQGGKIDNNNKKTDRGIRLEYRRTKEASKDVTKEVDVTDMNTIYDLNKRAMKMIEKPVKADDNGSIASLDRKAENPVTKVINFVGKNLGKLKFWAHGTPPSGHPGGHAVLGDGKGNNAGNELARLPNGKMFLSADRPTLYPNLPKGTHVLPARETKRILKSAPRYAQGTKDWQSLVEPSSLRNNEFMALLALNAKDSKTTVEVSAPSGGNKSKDYTKDLLDATLEQNNILMQILAKDNNVYLDSALLGSSVEPVVTEIQTMNKEVRDSFA
ncbi:phage tail tape measure protein [Virgibacillus dokdonensis]|uniref:Phage-related minor tail protein n=1 Tax=Virgibacillus dokdonensis TaxID=302167 RepID=A0A2K9J4A4_9BACI|nr:phage tail tape measure protein [Virgibacillus dokdonensis]AUJ26544.1 Phage-related minor tail protein [Virgibacillus dokdonensis]